LGSAKHEESSFLPPPLGPSSVKSGSWEITRAEPPESSNAIATDEDTGNQSSSLTQSKRLRVSEPC
jgi:hypothetical protein